MFSHVMVGTDNIEVSKKFYDSVLGALGYKSGVMDDKGRCFYIDRQGLFGVTVPIDGEPATSANGGTIGFNAKSTEAVDEWHSTGLQCGGSACEDPPGIREGSFGKLYVAYLRDPSGNKICAIHRIR